MVGGGGGGGGGGLQRRAGCGRPEDRPPQHCSFNPTKKKAKFPIDQKTTSSFSGRNQLREKISNFQTTRKRLHFLVYNIIRYLLIDLGTIITIKYYNKYFY